MSCSRIAGAHKLYYAAPGQTLTTYLGATGPEGIRQIRSMNMQQIQADQTGPETDVDAVFLGQNMEIQFVLEELDSDIAQEFLHPFQCTFASTVVTGVSQEHASPAGRLACAVAGVLEAIPVAFTPAQAFSGGSATGTAGVYPGTAATTPLSGRQYRGLVIGEIDESLGPQARFVPVRFKCYPFIDSGDNSIRKMWKWISTFTASGLSFYDVG